MPVPDFAALNPGYVGYAGRRLPRAVPIPTYTATGIIQER